MADPAHLRRPRALLAVVAVLLATLVPGASASAVTEPGGTGVGLTPAVAELDLSSRSYDFTLNVFNDSDRPRPVTVSAVSLGHELDGTPTFGDAIDAIDLSGVESPLLLAPGESRALELTASFPEDVALYAAVVVELAPDGSDSAVATRTRVGSLLLLRGPRPWDQSLAIRDLGVQAVEEETITLYVDVENIGDAHVRPTGTFTVRSEGTELLTAAFESEILIPGFARRLVATVPAEELPEGMVDLAVEIDDGPSAERSVDTSRPSTAEDPPFVATDGDPGTATLERVDNSTPTLLSLVALLLLLLALALFSLMWWKRGDLPTSGGEPDGNDEARASE